MTRLIRASVAAFFMFESGVIAFAAGTAVVDAPTPVISQALLDANRAERLRMDAFEAHVTHSAERAIASICAGCLPGPAAPPRAPQRAAQAARPRPVIRIAEARKPRAAFPLRLQRSILAGLFVPEE